jgi:cytochrome c oxidase subunit 3
MSNVPSASTDDYWLPPAAVRRATRGEIALRFLVLGCVVVLAAAGLGAGLMRLFGRVASPTFQFPAAFVASTLLLVLASGSIERARSAVRRERQREFRTWLWRALAIGVVFMGVQTFALWSIVPADRSAQSSSLGVTPFVLMLALLHGMHFLVATLFVSYITVQAAADRYDHEYHWGVTVCAWFWHVLGIVWLAILAVYSIALALQF